MGNITSRSKALIRAVQRDDLDEARELLQRCDARHLVECTDDRNMNALHWACQHWAQAPSDIIQSMLNASKRAPLEQDGYGETPLHWAISWSSEEIMIILIQACPRAASIASRGRTPLHRAIERNRSSKVIHHLLAANPTAATAINDDGDTPLCMLFRYWNVPLRNSLNSINGDDKAIQDVILRNEIGYQTRIGELYKTALLLLEAATHGSIEENQESPFRPLCAAINDSRCPWSMVNLILRLDTILAFEWNREEKLPIHVAATAAISSLDGELYECSTCQCRIQIASWSKCKRYIRKYCRNCFQKERLKAMKEEFDLINSVDKILAVIRDLLATNSTFAEIPDCEGRLPLHIAIENEKPFEGGLETILQAAPKACNTRDIKTHLYPFLLAAVKHNRAVNKLQKFTNCFTLLMDNPHFVSSGIPH